MEVSPASRPTRSLKDHVVSTSRFDAIIIGSGQAGPSLAARLSGAGMKTAIIERKRFGGTCVNTGCIPTKALVASARAAHVAGRGADYGVQVGGPVSVDMRTVKERKTLLFGSPGRGSSSGSKGWRTAPSTKATPASLTATSYGWEIMSSAPTKFSSTSARGPTFLPLPGLTESTISPTRA